MQRVLVTETDLGAPWVAVKDEKPAATDTPAEFCPGQPAPSATVKPRARQNTTLNEGAKPGSAIGSFSVATLEPGQEKAWRDAVTTALDGCRTYRQKDGYFVTATDIETLPRVKGADEVTGFIERIHEDIEYTKLLYVRQYLMARSGRLVSTTQYAVVQPKSDPTVAAISRW